MDTIHNFLHYFPAALHAGASLDVGKLVLASDFGRIDEIKDILFVLFFVKRFVFYQLIH